MEPSPDAVLEPAAYTRTRSHDFTRVYDAVRKTFEGNVTVDNAIVLLAEVMRAVEKIHDMSGIEKKNLALQVVMVLVDELAPEGSRAQVRAAVALLAPGVIDALVAAAKGQFALVGQAVNQGCGRLRSCCK